MPVESRTTESPESKGGLRKRLHATWRAIAALLATRAEIFQEELAQKGTLLRRTAIALALAFTFGWLAILLGTALMAALLARLLGSAVAGLLVAFVLYGVIAAVAAMMAWKALSSVQPLDFPVTREGIRKDWQAVESLVESMEAPAEFAPEDDLDQRFRTGSE